MKKREAEISKKKLMKIWDEFHEGPSLDLLLDSLRKNLGKDIDDLLYVHTHAPFVLKEVKSLARGSKILEAGCGLGQWAFWISEQGHHVVGIDISKKAISIAKTYARKNKIKTCSFLNADIRSIPFENDYFDHIFSFGVIEHFRNPAAILSEFYRVLKPGGRVFISVPNLYSFHTLKRPVNKILGLWKVGYERSYSRSDLRKLIKSSGFIVCKCGVMPGEEFFGRWPSYLPLVGKYLSKGLRRVSFYLEKKQKILGFWLYIVAKK